MAISMNFMNNEVIRAHKRIDELEDKIGSGSELPNQAVYVVGLDELKVGRLENTGTLVTSSKVNSESLNLVKNGMYSMMITLSPGGMHRAPLYCTDASNMVWESEFNDDSGQYCRFTIKRTGYILTAPNEAIQMGISLYKVKLYTGKHFR